MKKHYRKDNYTQDREMNSRDTAMQMADSLMGMNRQKWVDYIAGHLDRVKQADMAILKDTPIPAGCHKSRDIIIAAMEKAHDAG